MKVILTTSGNNLEASLDSRFGRCPKFLVYDLASKSFEVVDNNQNLNASHGAGIQAAETVIKTGAKTVITGHCGPKAFKVLKSAGIKIFHADTVIVKDALELYQNEQLKEIDGSEA